ncbi:MAG: DUF2177 family protein [Paracoccaceae bacterium]
MPVPILFLAAALTLAVLDAVMLTAFMAPFFRSQIGHLMLGTPRALPALIFYAGYIAGLTALVTRPALRAGSAGQAALMGGVLGLTAYGTFEFTALALLADWTWGMAVTDTLWGGVLTGAAAWVAVWAAVRLGYGGR